MMDIFFITLFRHEYEEKGTVVRNTYVKQKSIQFIKRGSEIRFFFSMKPDTL